MSYIHSENSQNKHEPLGLCFEGVKINKMIDFIRNINSEPVILFKNYQDFFNKHGKMLQNA